MDSGPVLTNRVPKQVGGVNFVWDRSCTPVASGRCSETQMLHGGSPDLRIPSKAYWRKTRSDVSMPLEGILSTREVAYPHPQTSENPLATQSTAPVVFIGLARPDFPYTWVSFPFLEPPADAEAWHVRMYIYFKYNARKNTTVHYLLFSCRSPPPTVTVESSKFHCKKQHCGAVGPKYFGLVASLICWASDH